MHYQIICHTDFKLNARTNEMHFSLNLSSFLGVIDPKNYEQVSRNRTTYLLILFTIFRSNITSLSYSKVSFRNWAHLYIQHAGFYEEICRNTRDFIASIVSLRLFDEVITKFCRFFLCPNNFCVPLIP